MRPRSAGPEIAASRTMAHQAFHRALRRTADPGQRVEAARRFLSDAYALPASAERARPCRHAPGFAAAMACCRRFVGDQIAHGITSPYLADGDIDYFLRLVAIDEDDRRRRAEARTRVTRAG